MNTMMATGSNGHDGAWPSMGDRRSSYVRGRETGAQQMAALTARGYNAEAKAGVDVMKGFLYICGGEVGTS